MSDRVRRAMTLAAESHGAQEYGEGVPYYRHLQCVAGRVVRWGEDAVVTALLHDAVEDTHLTLAQIEGAFGAHVSDCVALVTDPPGKDRRERKEAAHAKLAAIGDGHHDALVVKVADRLCNVAACARDASEGSDVLRRLARKRLAMYRQEHPAFREAAHRPGLCDDLWDELDALLGHQP